jgi:hypothetical protein
VEDYLGELTITAVYCPPKHNTKCDEYERFFKTLGHRFIAGSDYNAKNTSWDSRLTTKKGRELHKAMRNNNNISPHGNPHICQVTLTNCQIS